MYVYISSPTRSTSDRLRRRHGGGRDGGHDLRPRPAVDRRGGEVELQPVLGV